MTDNLALTIHALNRVLYHLSNEQQAQHAHYDISLSSLAEARVLVKRRLAFVTLEVDNLWQVEKEKP